MSTKQPITVLITGGNGALGSHIAFEIAKTHPEAFLLLTARRENDSQADKISAQLNEKGVKEFEFLSLDLSSFASVKAFVAKVTEKVQQKTIPPIAVQINCAAYSSFLMDEKTKDNFDPVYQTNVLSPFILTVSLLKGAFQRSSSGAPQGRVINIASETVSMGKLDFFNTWGPTEKNPLGAKLSIIEGLTRYGSSKLLADVVMYSLKEKLTAAGSKSLNIFSLDPGGMHHNSNLSRGTMPAALSTVASLLSLVGPVARLFQKSIINHPRVPAAAVAKTAFDPSTERSDEDVYFVLDNQIGTKRIEKAMQEHKTEVFEKVLKDAGVSAEEIKALAG